MSDVPPDLDVRVANRDTTALPDGALVRYQRIGLEKSPRLNRRFVLFEDGRCHAARHSGDDENWQQPFDTELPEEPSGTAPDEIMAAIREQLVAVGFVDRPPYQVGVRAKGGKVEVVTARVGDVVHEVMYENAESPLLDLLITVPDLVS